MSSLNLHQNHFSLDGVSSKDFGVWTNGYRTFNGAGRDVEHLIVPGRNGSLVKDNGRFENCEFIYEGCGIVRENALKNYQALRAFLAAHMDGYYRLEDTYHLDEYRLARFVGPLDPEIGANYDTATFDLIFDCKPQHFLKSGEEWVENPTSIRNKTLFTAKPLIRIYGTGTLTVGSAVITIASHSLDYIDIDCDLGDASCGAENANRYVTMPTVPELPPGETGISGTVSSYKIQPRWWTE